MFDAACADADASIETAALIPAPSRDIARSFDVAVSLAASMTSLSPRAQPQSFAELLPSTGHAWTARKVPLYTAAGMAVPNRFGVAREDSGAVLGVVGTRYTITQPMDLARSLDSLFSGLPIRLEGAMSLNGGSDLALVAALPDELSLRLFRGADVTQPRVIFRTSYDGSSNTTGCLLGRRLVCSNGLRIDEVVPGSTWKVRHTARAEARREYAVQSLRAWAGQWKLFQEAAELLSRRTLGAGQARDLVSRIVLEPSEILPPESEPKRSPAKARAIEVIIDLVEGGLGTEVAGVRGTAWGVFQAVNEYSNHYAPARGTREAKAERRVERVLDGDELSRRAFRTLLTA